MPGPFGNTAICQVCVKLKGDAPLKYEILISKFEGNTNKTKYETRIPKFEGNAKESKLETGNTSNFDIISYFEIRISNFTRQLFSFRHIPLLIPHTRLGLSISPYPAPLPI